MSFTFRPAVREKGELADPPGWGKAFSTPQVSMSRARTDQSDQEDHRLTEEYAKQFLEEYRSLCRKHGLIVCACQCCSSPWLVLCPDREITLEAHIEHLKKGVPK